MILCQFVWSYFLPPSWRHWGRAGGSRHDVWSDDGHSLGPGCPYVWWSLCKCWSWSGWKYGYDSSPKQRLLNHYSDVIMSAMSSQIIGVSIVCLVVCSGFRHRLKKISKLRVTGLCEGNPPVTAGFPYKGPVQRKCFHLMTSSWLSAYSSGVRHRFL